MLININFSDLFFSKTGSVNILGTGPSLFYCDPKRFDKRDSIYVNSSALLLPKSFNSFKLWVSIDRLCLKWSYFWDYVIKSSCDKFVGSDFNKYSENIAKYGFKYFDVRKDFDERFNLHDNKLFGVTSLIAALELAMKMGYKEIFLYGVDQRFIQGRSHFWQFYPPYKQPKFVAGRNISLKEQKKKFDESKKYFILLNEVAKTKNIKIYNCSKRVSALEVFEKI